LAQGEDAMRFDILTIFPDFFDGPLRSGVLGRALADDVVACHVHNLRDWTTDRHHATDDAPYGGGGGMVMLAEPLLAALRDLRERSGQALGLDVAAAASPRRPQVVYLSPQGEPLTRGLAAELATEPGLILLCGSYEGIDERVAELEVDREVSIGDYVLTSGEPAALVLLNAVARRLEGVVGNPASVPNDSFEDGLLDFPHYTRPDVIEGLPVPLVLLSGHHARIAHWRHQRQLERTARRRPDLLARLALDRDDLAFLRGAGLAPPSPSAPIPPAQDDDA
jgi:tRNA (guanine37-N1)-methyltransferase